MREKRPFLAFNRGIISALGLGRIELPRVSISAATQTNWIPRVLGSMIFRPGLRFLSATRNDSASRNIPFVFSFTDQALIEVTSGNIRVRVNDLLIERATVSSSVTNGDFTSDLSGWTDNDEAGATSQHLVGGFMSLTGDGTNFAIRSQQVTVSAGDQNTEHALRVDVPKGPVRFRVGSTAAGEDYIGETLLGTGEHSLAFTPTGDFHIQFSNERSYSVHVDSINVEAVGVVEIPAPWATTNLPDLRWDQSGDVMYVACDGSQQRKIERRAIRSWSLVEYEPEDGPFRVQNTSKTTIAPSALIGDITLTASKPTFKTTHVGALFRIASQGQTVTAAISAENTFTNPIRVTGVDTGRTFGIIVEGTFVATVNVQYSVGAPGSWIDLASPFFTAPANTSHNDGQDNQIIFYRIGVKTGAYTSGTVNVTLNFAAGSISGVARVTNYTSETSVAASVLSDMGDTQASADWWEGEWSLFRGHPTSVSLYEGRLWWAGQDKIYGSISDAFESFDDEVEGDSGPISRSIGSGPVENIHWLLAMTRLLIGNASNSANVAAVKLDGNSVLSARSNSFAEPLTPTNLNLKNDALRGVFVDRSKQRIYELAPSADANSSLNDYSSADLSIMTPDLNEVGIKQIAVQFKPEIRIHCVRDDGKVGLCIFDRAENVICWVLVETDGDIEDVAVLPDQEEDKVYYVVERTINTVTRRYVERWAKESEVVGGTLNHQADSYITYLASTQTLDHLEAESVVAWGGGRDLGSFTVTGGQITLPAGITQAIVGLSYTAQYESSRLASVEGITPTRRKKGTQLGLTVRNTHYQGIKYGPTLGDLLSLPKVEGGKDTPADTVWTGKDGKELDPFALGGNIQTDSRVCLQATAPRPASIISAMLDVEGRP